ncbi:right-handed parallel beta-helix repeat-containing protein [Eubacterium oxidoreducens]|uniref:Right handed beta helix region n=1 Tax=Eubacterium oxidoreducens TaxID=1732 RepID=A0A1G6CNL7_EUBOX|nr:right-handed parallel beta-helix repeat-containing protein [Eubacterium oxidoreducens]SDB34479.1 hypothetical protein SAMN02910417_02545 [Eubacterium oxidoreducens]
MNTNLAIQQQYVRTQLRRITIAVIALCAVWLIFSIRPVHAAQAGDTVTYNNNIIATYTNSNTVTYHPSEDSNQNYKWLNYLLSKSGKLTINIPSGSDFHINGPLIPTSNKTINATGSTITMKPNTYVMMTNPTKAIKNLTIKGGTWRSPDDGGRKGSMFQFAFASNITLDGIDVNANFSGHSIEIIACSNVTIKNCTVRAIGSNPKNCKEEQIQIDVSTKATAPKVAAYGAKYVKGQTCKNIKIINNTVYGARAIGVNYHASCPSKYHKNIVIKNNVLHSTTSEAIQFFNVINGTISGNKIRTDATRKTDNASYTIAVHIQNNGKAPAAMKSSVITVKNNLIYGNRNGIYVKGYSTSGRFGKVKVTKNTVYCKKGKANCIDQTRGSCRSFKVTANKKHKWTKSTDIQVNLA